MWSSIRQPLFWTAVLLLAVAAAFPLLSEPGLLNTRGGGDSPFLLQRLQQLETAVLDGHFPARWMPDANYGYGYPFYNFYAPLSIYITLLFRLLGFSYVQAIQLSQLAGFLVAAAAMFALARRWFQNEWAALLAATAYTFAPFHMVNVYVRGDSLAEFWAMAFYPLVLWATDKLFESGKGQVAGQRQPPAPYYLPLVTFALAYAALILSHNISALIFSPFLLLYCVLRIAYERSSSSHHQSPITNHRLRITDYGLPLTAAFLLAFALSAWFFVPALAEKGLAQLGPVTEGYFHFSNHFLGGDGQPLWQSAILFDYRVDGREAFRMGLVQTVTILIGVFLLLLPQNRRLSAFVRVSLNSYQRLFILLALLLSTLLLLPWSRPLWDHLPLLSFTQFPWRLLSVQAFAGALAVGVLGLLPGRRVIVPVTAVLLIVAALGNLQTDHLPLTDADVTPERLAQYEWFTGNIGTTVSAEYLPYSVQPRMVTSGWLEDGERWPVRALAGELQSATLQTAKTGRQSWQVQTAVPSTLQFPTMAWPGWQAQVDGEGVAIRPSPGSGLIEVDVPAGVHLVELHLTRTAVRLVAEITSLLALLFVLCLLLTRLIHITNRGRIGKVIVIAGLCLLLLILLARLWPQPALTENELTWDFAQMAYLHHAPEGVAFSNGALLQSYQPGAEGVEAGEVLTIETFWGSANEMPVTLRLMTPASNRVRDPAPPVLAEETVLIQDEQATFRLQIPANAPAGLVVPQIMLADGRALTPSGQERGELFLRPLRVANSIPAQQDQPALDVRLAAVRQPSPTLLDLQLVWRTAVPLTQNYNVALRLTDARGQFLQLADMQPGYGFQPSSLWPVGEWVTDWLALSLPTGDYEYPYLLVAQLVDVSTPQQPLLTRFLGELWPEENGAVRFQPHEPLFLLPAEIEEVTAVFAGNLQLHGYELTQTVEALNLNLYWSSAQSTSREYTRFVHLIPTGGEQPVAQDDAMPRYGTYPTSQWLVDEIVTDPIMIPLTAVPPGQYQLAVGFYERLPDGSFPRLTAVDVNGRSLSQNRLILPQLITIP